MILFDNRAMDELAHNRITVSKPGKYSVWVWARGGSSFRLGIGNVWLDVEGFGPYRPFSWGRIGEVELAANRPYSLQLDTEEGTDNTGVITRLAISLSNFNPQRAFELMNVYEDDRSRTPDERSRETRHTNSYFQFPEYRTEEEWEERRSQIRRKILVNTGLWPMPEKYPLNVKVVDTLDRDGYVVEKLYMETSPGIYFPGALYRPKGKTGPFPAIINPKNFA